jgi:UDP-N-acetylglucosamine/UDP-N-acetylgalactosamine diphosphorylase
MDLPSNTSIFQIHIEKIARLKAICTFFNNERGLPAPRIPIYLMTSDLNHRIITEFFHSNQFFGYPADDIIFFEQGLEPSFTFDGKIIIESEKSLSLSPDGNGGNSGA